MIKLINMSKFKLALVELYLPLKHGIVQERQYSSLYSNYLILDTIDLDEFYENINHVFSDIKHSNDMYTTYINILKYQMNIDILHPIIQNYEKIITNPKHCQIQIIQPVTVSIGPNEWDQYSTAVIKTHLICLIQRKWRSVLKKRINLRRKIENLKFREITGHFPQICNVKFKLGI